MAGGGKNSKSETPAPQEEAKETPFEKWIPGQLLVSFKDEGAAAKRAELWKKYGAQEVEKVGSSPLYLIQFPKATTKESDLKDLQAKISKEPGVKYAEPNMVMKTFK